MRKHFYLFLSVILLVSFATAAPAAGEYKNNNGNNYCPVTPTPTSEITITPTPTIVTPTQIVSPSDTPTPTSAPSTGGTGNVPSNPHTDTTEAPAAATCTIPFSPPALTSITAGASGTLNVNWLESDSHIDNFSINYGYVGQPLTMGVPNIPATSTSYPITMLQSGESINARVCAYKNGCAQCSSVVDPLVP